MPGRGPLSKVRTAVRSPLGLLPSWPLFGAPARQPTSHSLMPSATPSPSNEALSGAITGGAAGFGVGTAATGTAGGDEQLPFAAMRSLAVIGRSCLACCVSEKV